MLFPMAEQGKFYNLQEFLDTDADISPDTLVPNITYSLEPGNVIGIGPGPESFGLFYNEDIFKEAGVEPPPSNVADAWTWDEFVEVAKKLTVDMNGKTAADPDFDPAKKSSNMEQISPPGGGVQQLHLFQRRGFHLGGRQNLRP
ncbi:extracellular solute-binding protein [Paenibacillus rhizoplanae]